jgi:hypothetical protein
MFTGGVPVLSIFMEQMSALKTSICSCFQSAPFTKPPSGTPTAQFFVGSNLVRSEDLSGEEQIAILLDVPGDGTGTSITVRLASTSPYVGMGFQGMDCYLL